MLSQPIAISPIRVYRKLYKTYYRFC